MTPAWPDMTAIRRQRNLFKKLMADRHDVSTTPQNFWQKSNWVLVRPKWFEYSIFYDQLKKLEFKAQKYNIFSNQLNDLNLKHKNIAFVNDQLNDLNLKHKNIVFFNDQLNDLNLKHKYMVNI